MADALAEIRDPDWLVSIAAQVFVVQPPFKPPTGRTSASSTSSDCCANRRSARSASAWNRNRRSRRTCPSATSPNGWQSYNMLAVGVADRTGRLLGAITVDDVLDRTLPTGWRQRRRVAAFTGTAPRGGVAVQVAMKRHEDLTTPRRRARFGFRYDSEAFGQFAEAIARTLGTARFLAFQTVFVVLWILLNVALMTWKWDPYPFILLNLAFSTQAAYAAPLILLAQTRQENRDRAQAETDRRTAERTQDETEFLARELAGVRRALTNVVTTEDIDEHVERLAAALDRIGERLDRLEDVRLRGDGVEQPQGGGDVRRRVDQGGEVVGVDLLDRRAERLGQGALVARLDQVVVRGDQRAGRLAQARRPRTSVVQAQRLAGLDDRQRLVAVDLPGDPTGVLAEVVVLTEQAAQDGTHRPRIGPRAQQRADEPDGAPAQPIEAGRRRTSGPSPGR